MQFRLCLLIEIKKKWVKFTVESYMIEKECDYLFKYTSGTVSVHNYLMDRFFRDVRSRWWWDT